MKQPPSTVDRTRDIWGVPRPSLANASCEDSNSGPIMLRGNVKRPQSETLRQMMEKKFKAEQALWDDKEAQAGKRAARTLMPSDEKLVNFVAPIAVSSESPVTPAASSVDSDNAGSEFAHSASQKPHHPAYGWSPSKAPLDPVGTSSTPPLGSSHSPANRPPSRQSPSSSRASIGSTDGRVQPRGTVPDVRALPALGGRRPTQDESGHPTSATHYAAPEAMRDVRPSAAASMASDFDQPGTRLAGGGPSGSGSPEYSFPPPGPNRPTPPPGLKLPGVREMLAGAGYDISGPPPPPRVTRAVTPRLSARPLQPGPLNARHVPTEGHDTRQEPLAALSRQRVGMHPLGAKTEFHRSDITHTMATPVAHGDARMPPPAARGYGSSPPGVAASPSLQKAGQAHLHSQPTQGGSAARFPSSLLPPPRPRVSLACQFCRSRKLRCSSGPGPCEHCSRRGRECVFEATPKTAGAVAAAEVWNPDGTRKVYQDATATGDATDGGNRAGLGHGPKVQSSMPDLRLDQSLRRTGRPAPIAPGRYHPYRGPPPVRDPPAALPTSRA